MNGVASVPKTHNRPPVSIPDEADLLADLKERYPTAQPTLDEMVEAAKDVPPVIKDEETAGKLQLLLKKLASNSSDWESLGVSQARGWKTAGNIVRGWFKAKEDKADTLIKDLKPRLTKWLEDKAAKEQEEADRKAELARAAAAEKKFYADWDEAIVELAEINTRLAREAEEAARKREDDAREDQLRAEALAELAEYDARKAQERQAALEAEAAERRVERKKELRRLTAEAKKLGLKDAEGMTPLEMERYRELIGQNGQIPALKALLLDDRNLLTHEERAELDDEIATLDRLRQERIANSAKAEAARTRAMQAMEESTAHAAEASGLEKAAPKLEKQAERSGKVAAVHENRAVRTEMAAENLTAADASRTRGTGGTVGTLTGSWQPRVDDFDAIVPAMLWPYIAREAIDAAITKYRFDNQAAWVEQRGVGPGKGLIMDLPGVTFVWTPDARVAG